MTDAKMIFESEFNSTAGGGLVRQKAPAEGSRTFSTEFKFWFEKLTFAISKQRLTLAGQEIAALREVYQRGLLV